MELFLVLIYEHIHARTELLSFSACIIQETGLVS